MGENNRQLWHPKPRGWVAIPDDIAVCPECGSGLVADSHGWSAATGRPVASGLQIECVFDDDEMGRCSHRYWQSDWQSVRDAIVKWCGARTL